LIANPISPNVIAQICGFTICVSIPTAYPAKLPRKSKKTHSRNARVNNASGSNKALLKDGITCYVGVWHYGTIEKTKDTLE